MAGFARLAPLLGLLLLLAPGRPAVAREKRIVLHQDDVSLEAVESETVTRKKARKVLAACRKAFAGIANRFAWNSQVIWFTDRPLPPWLSKDLRKDPRIWVEMTDGLRTKDMGADAYLARMRKGVFRIYLPAPAEDDLSAEDIHRIWREMAYAVLAEPLWVACPLWLREGVAETLAIRGTKGEHALLESLREELRESGDDLPVSAVIAATDRSAWARSGGRAISWALVTMLEESNPKIVPSLVNQSRLLLERLVLYRKESTVRKEYTDLVASQLLAGSGAETCRRAVEAFVEAGFPEGSAYRRTDAHKLLKGMRTPKQYGAGLAVRFGTRSFWEDEWQRIHRFQPYGDAQITWRLPWPTQMEAWVGVRGQPGTNFALRPSKKLDGYYVSFEPWSAKSAGSQRLKDGRIGLPTATTKFGFIWLGAISPNGLGYMFRKEYKLK